MRLTPAQRAVLASLHAGLAYNDHIPEDDNRALGACRVTLRSLWKIDLVDDWDQLTPTGYEAAGALEAKQI